MRNNELADISGIAMPRFYKLVGTNGELLGEGEMIRYTAALGVWQGGGSYSSLAIWVRDANQAIISPLEDYQAHDGVGAFWYTRVEKLDEDKWVNRSAPCLPTVHAYKSLLDGSR